MIMNQNGVQLRSIVASLASASDPNLEKCSIENVNTSSSTLLCKKT